MRSLLVLAVLVAALLGLACGDDGRSRAGTTAGATVVNRARVTPRILDLRVRSPALGKETMVRLMTPVGWSSSSTSRRWPVLYLLHGCCDSYVSWTRSTDIEQLPQLRMFWS